jgi:hypothetical protein
MSILERSALNERVGLLVGCSCSDDRCGRHIAHASGRSDEDADQIFGIKIPPGYRDWKLISVVHEEGNVNGKPAGEALLKTCFPCHEPVKARDFVFTHYAP